MAAFLFGTKDKNESQGVGAAASGRVAAAGGAAARPDAGPSVGREAAGSSRLDSKSINGSDSRDDGDALLILPCRCRSWCCASCGPGYWCRIGARINPHLGMFKRPKLLTLTLDRKQFDSARDAYEFTRPKIRTFLRLLGFKKAFVVLAFHPSAREWPHWHILVDLADCGSWVDLKRMWRLWRDQWGCGGFDLDTGQTHGNAHQAARYILSYCQHQAGVIADWALDMPRAPRAYECYGELRAAIRQSVATEVFGNTAPDIASHDDDASLEEHGEAPPSEAYAALPPSRTVRERLAECGKGAVVVLRRMSGGVATHRFLGTLPVTPGRLALAQELGELHTLDIRRQTRELVNGTQVLDVSIPVGDQDLKELRRLLDQECSVLAMRDRERRPEMSPAFDAPYWDDADPSGPIPDHSADGVAPF